MKLICFDMDGVIFEHDNFWLELHKSLGTYEEGKKLTEKYVKTDYERLVKEVVGRLWKGRSADKYFILIRKTKYIKGARETFKELKKQDLKTAIISSGPKHLAMRAKKELGIDYIFSNDLEIKKNIITGKFHWPLGYGHTEKTKIVRNLAREIGIQMKEVAYVGDSENDIDVCRKVGVSISFNSKSKELDKVCKVVVKQKDLRKIIKIIHSGGV